MDTIPAGILVISTITIKQMISLCVRLKKEIKEPKETNP
jgi:hypothetical protein